MMKTLTKTFTLALAVLAAPFAAEAAGAGNIYAIFPLDRDGNVNPPTTKLVGGETAQFVVRLQKNAMGGNPFRLKHVGFGSEAVDWESRRPKIGIYVSGEFRTATLKEWGPLANGGGEICYTDFVFEYQVKPGDFELPMRLADRNGKMITDVSDASEFYFDFLHDTKYAPAWTIDDSAEGGSAGTAANLWFTTEYGTFYNPGDGSIDYVENYDFEQCKFYIQTVDFDENDETDDFWRTVHEGSRQTGGAQPTLHLDGLPTNAVTLYVWSMDESAVKVVGETKPIHVASATATEDRQVATIKVVAGKTDYPFDIEGVTKGRTTQLVLSAFPDFQYGKTGAAAPIRLDDFATVTVTCTEPLPASVKVQPAQTRVTATATSWQSKVTELAVTFSEPFSEDVEVEIVTGFSKTGSELPWSDYVRFSEKADEDVTLQAEPIANPKVLIPAGSKVPTQFVGGAAIVDGKIYVYALRADGFSDGSSKLTFGVKTTNEHAAKSSSDGGIDGWISEEKPFQSTLIVVAQDPEIQEPTEGKAFKAFASNPCTFQIKVSDDWANMTNAYTVSIWKDSTDGSDFVELTDDYVPDPKTGILYKKGTKELPSVTYTLRTEPYDTAIKVKSTVSENESDVRHVAVSVGAQKGYSIEIADGVSEFDEGTFTQLKITFDELVPDDCYAFLKPVGEASNVVAECSWLAGDPEAEGQWIRAGETELTFDEFQIMDGDASKSGSSWKFDVVLLTKSSWSDDTDDLYGKFKAKNTVTYKVRNVTPYVTGMTPDDKPSKRIKASGETIKGAWPKSDTLKHTFEISVEEPGLWDKTIGKEGKKFETVVVFYNEDEGDAEYYPDEAPEDGVIYGDPDTNTCTRVFEYPGHYRCEVMLKDKDMKDYDFDQKFIFYFDVVDNPAITVETEPSYEESNVAEFGGDAKVTVKLAVNDCNFPMYLKLNIAPNNDSDNPGEFLLETNLTSCVWQPDGSYIVTIPKGKTDVVLPVLRMDGTRDSAITGFQITGELPVALNNANKVPGSDDQYPYEYYQWSDPPAFKVRNVAPNLEEFLDPMPSTNVYRTAAGESDVLITWTFMDVTPDFERAVQGGVTITFSGGGGKWETNLTSYAEMSAVGTAGWRPNFAGKSGRQTVMMTVKDHDGGSLGPYMWEFEVEVSKSMQMIAHGPTTGFGAANGDRYSTKANGLGEGRVWAMSLSDISASYWTSIVNCGLETRFTVYAYGYKVGDIDDGVHLYLPGGREAKDWYVKRDTPLSGAGNSLAKGGSAGSYYKYVPRADAYGRPVDSFLYTWLQIAADEGGGDSGALADTFLNGTVAPEMSEQNDAGRVLTLTAEKDEAGYYPMVQLEAVFSIEKFWSDNMGDINQDGVPDAYAKKYGFEIFDANGLVTGDDLKALDSYNNDASDATGGAAFGGTGGDFLPATVEQSYAGFIPGLPDSWPTLGAKFTAKLEIRGYGEHLNDAPALVGMVGVKPERVYEVDGHWNETNCTLSELEYMAWKESGLPQDKWSPERPTDPTLTDTDGDGYPDGYEYYFWYRAHVGYLDADGVHRYETGRRFDPRNPGEGRHLSRMIIANLMDPRSDLAASDVPTSESDRRLLAQLKSGEAEARDTDNDGLPDLLEFMIGTNPFDFDTDGDGLPDGFEILLNGTDPLNAYTTKNICDAMRNYDGDAMAFTTPELESNVLPLPKEIKTFTSFAAVTDDFKGDSDGVQWYVTRDFSSYTNFVYDTPASGTVVQVNGVLYFTTNAVRTVDGRLGTDLTARGDVWTVSTNLADAVRLCPDLATLSPAPCLRLAPARLAPGTPLELIEYQEPATTDEEDSTIVTSYTAPVTATVLRFGTPTEGLNAAWIYGSDRVSTTTDANNMLTLGGFGMLAMGRYLDVPAGAALAALPSSERPVALMHYLVYQEFGFDPRTAWNAHTPLAARWGISADGEAVESTFNKGAGGYAGIATRTREFTAYDEFLLLSFWLNNGTIADADVTPGKPEDWYKIWSKYTTNAQGPGELWEPDDENYKGRTAETQTDTNGADSDLDGVPDGWELYVMSGPKEQTMAGFKFRFVAPYNDNHFSHFGPFVGDAADASWTDAGGTSGYASTPGDNDKLTELREFAGTDSCNWYSKPQKGNTVAFSTTIVRPEVDAKWLNKFFPTDPWNVDTDNDGIDDGFECTGFVVVETTAKFACGNFIYGTPVDDGTICIPGGGLNPLTIDTDGDGLPDLWESQFAGSRVYAGEFKDESGNPVIDYTKDQETGEEGNPRQGLVDGMDGTVQDAFSYPLTVAEENSATNVSSYLIERYTITRNAGIVTSQVVNRDYDRDGLENWQEYMTGMMRCWRYDDPLSRWDALPDELYYDTDADGNQTFNVDKAAKALFSGDTDKFWYETLVNVGGEYYNPHLVTGMNPANYMSRVTNPWDKAYTDEGAYYWLPGRIGDTLIPYLWCNPMSDKCLPISDKMLVTPVKYACCSPIDADSDHDGLDDYYELFHGMNPLLGLSGVTLDSGADDEMRASNGPCDLVYDAWYKRGAGALEAWAPTASSPTANYWQRDAGLKARHDARFAASGIAAPADGFDFEVYPWLNGLQQADPDGDDIRNVYEAIEPRLVDGGFYLHTDPTPLWMTDSSYSNSLTRLFFRLQTRDVPVELARDSFEYEGTTYLFRDFDGYVPPVPMQSPAMLGAYSPESWSVAGSGYNWLYSFEENEGFDSDHDFVGDYNEAQGKTHAATDPQDADSPRHRQAMYFPGWDADAGVGSALQTMPEELERHPLGSIDYPDSQALQTFTVELWVQPESVDENVAQTVLERAIWVGASQVADSEYLRKNFQLGIRNGKWFVKYDTSGTSPTDSETGKTFEYTSPNNAVAGRWTHLAVTFDGTKVTVFVDGVANSVSAHLAPATAVTALALHGEKGKVGDYWFSREYKYHAFVVGASLKGYAELGSEGYKALDLSQASTFGWNAYKDFFRGYVDEIRVWDGARASDDVIDDFVNRKRYTREDAIENRSAAYKAWLADKRIPELLHHWSFDSVAGAENAKQVAKWPVGFAEEACASMSRPAGYAVDWWKNVVDALGSAYAGKCDWVTWIPDTVGHLPRYDGTTLDSVFWSADFAGGTAGTYTFPRTAEPVTRWSQMTYGAAGSSLGYRTTGSRHNLVNGIWLSNTNSQLYAQFEFNGRHLTCSGADLLPLGGAFVKYVGALWDDRGASSIWEQTGSDANANGLPDWWEKYADQNYRPTGVPPGRKLAWDMEVLRNGLVMSAGEAYLRDLAGGMYVDAAGRVQNGQTYRQTAKSDGLIPDWWKDLFKIGSEDPFADGDFDGLNNYLEYVGSEELPFGLRLDPCAARSDKKTLDYFLPVGKLYLGEMLTDHDLMEDAWERSLTDTEIADTTIWDALKDADEDGWTNFDENRYNEYRMSTLAQLASHAVGDAEVLDAPVPSVKLLVRYNGTHFKEVSASGGAQQQTSSASGGTSSGDEGESISIARKDIPNLIVRTYSDGVAQTADAEFSVKPGESVDRAVYLGGWEDRIVRGTMAPGNIDLGSVNLMFAQVPQSDMYSWMDENGLHLSGTYAEFKAALEKNPEILQNVQAFDWNELTDPFNQYVSSDRAVTVTRDALTQKGYIAVYGERVGTVDLTTGDFEFDMGAMMSLSPNYTFTRADMHDAWSYKEAIFKLTYSATVPSVQTKRFQVTLAKADKGFMKGGRNTIVAFFDNNGDSDYTPGEPFGVLNDVDIGWYGRTLELELTDMSAVSPRVNLWSDVSDRTELTGAANDEGVPEVVTIKTTETTTTNGITTVRIVERTLSNGVEKVTAPASRTYVNVSRYRIDGDTPEKAGVGAKDNLVFRQAFDSDTRTFLHEGDFLRNGALDIDWGTFDEVTSFMRTSATRMYELTNVIYAVTFEGDTDLRQNPRQTNAVAILSTLVSRRFEAQRTIPTPCPDRMVFSRAQPTFAWKIEGEDEWASKFGTTYTAFKVIVRDAAEQVIYDSGCIRLPAKDSEGVYSWTAPIYVGSLTPQGMTFKNLENYTWAVALYNAKFSDDEYVSMRTKDNPFCAQQKFRMNVTTEDASSRQVAVGVSYAGPAAALDGKVRVQAFETPDFTGGPVAEMTIGSSVTNDTGDTVLLTGLAEGSYFLRAFIDTNANGVRDDWESWGYLCERDRANKAALFNPVIAEAKFNPNTKDVRWIYIEDCDTNVNYFPDVWEAEQNGGVFDPAKIGPVTGNAKLIGVNPNLARRLNAGGTAFASALPKSVTSLVSPMGVALMTGVAPADVVATADGFEVKPEVDRETLTIVGLNVDAAENRVVLKVGAETTANVDSVVANFLSVTVRKGAEVTIKVEHADLPAGPWKVLPGVGGTVTIDRAGTDVEVKLDGELPAQGFFRAKIEE